MHLHKPQNKKIKTGCAKCFHGVVTNRDVKFEGTVCNVMTHRRERVALNIHCTVKNCPENEEILPGLDTSSSSFLFIY